MKMFECLNVAFLSSLLTVTAESSVENKKAVVSGYRRWSEGSEGLGHGKEYARAETVGVLRGDGVSCPFCVC